MTDVVREALRAGSIPSAEMEILTEILTVLFNDELSMNNMVDIHLIALTYFDKLLDAIIAHIPQESTMEEVLLDVQSRATSLQHKWQQRFKEKWAFECLSSYWTLLTRASGTSQLTTTGSTT
jgi:hypothetical protein